LINLLRLQQIQNGFDYEGRVGFLIDGERPSSGNGLAFITRLSKVPLEYRLPDTDPFPEKDPTAEELGSYFQDSDGFTTFPFPELGRYRLDTYQVSPAELIQSTVVDLVRSDQRTLQIVEEKKTAASGTITLRNGNVVRFPKRDFEPFDFGIDEKFESLGTINGASLYYADVVTNSDLEFNSSGIRIVKYPIVFGTRDGIRFEANILYEIAAREDSSASLSENISFSLPAQTASEIYFLALIGDGSSTPLAQYLVRVQWDRNLEVSIRPIQPRPNRTFTANYLQIWGNSTIAYEDRDLGGGNPEIVINRNFFTNTTADQPANINGDGPFGSDAYQYAFPQSGALLGSPDNQSNLYGVNTLASIRGNASLDEAAYSFTRPNLSFLHPAENIQFRLFGHRYKMFLQEMNRIASGTTRISSAPGLFAFANVTFSGGVTRNAPIPFPQIQTYVFSPEKTIFAIPGNSPFAPPSHILEANHQTNTFRNFTLNSGRALPAYLDYSESSPAVSEIGIGKRYYISLKTPNLTRDFEDIFGQSVYVSRSLDGINWSVWKKAKIQPPKRRTP
jgi:hypothetical protein